MAAVYSHGPSQSAKRRKTDDTVPEWESARPQWEQELGESARQQLNQIVDRSWASINANSPAGMTGAHPMLNGMNGSAARPQAGNNNRNNSLSWASVNQPNAMSGQQFGNGGEGNAAGFRINMEQGSIGILNWGTGRYGYGTWDMEHGALAKEGVHLQGWADEGEMEG